MWRADIPGGLLMMPGHGNFRCRQHNRHSPWCTFTFYTQIFDNTLWEEKQTHYDTIKTERQSVAWVPADLSGGLGWRHSGRGGGGGQQRLWLGLDVSVVMAWHRPPHLSQQATPLGGGDAKWTFFKVRHK